MIIKKRIRSLIYDSLMQVELKDIERYDQYPKIKVEFSYEFEKKLSNLIANKSSDNIPKRKLIIAIVTALLLISLEITSYAFRESILNFFIDIYDEYTHISDVDDEREEVISKYYSPTWMPEGYMIESSKQGKIMHIRYWDKNGDKIVFTQTIHSNNNLYFNDNDGSYSVLTLASHDVYHSDDGKMQTFIWLYDGYTMKIDCSHEIDVHYVEQIIKSISIV